MRNIVLLSVCLCCCLLETLVSTFLIIPDELLSVAPPIYSQYPTIHTGTDSRLGWGFRLGRYADFQVLVELGPQKYTQPINKYQKKTGAASLKRSTTNNLPDENNVRNYRQIPNQKHEEERSTSSNQASVEWLRRWSEEVKGRTKQNQWDSKINTVSNKTEEKLESNGHEMKIL